MLFLAVGESYGGVGRGGERGDGEGDVEDGEGEAEVVFKAALLRGGFFGQPEPVGETVGGGDGFFEADDASGAADEGAEGLGCYGAEPAVAGGVAADVAGGDCGGLGEEGG